MRAVVRILARGLAAAGALAALGLLALVVMTPLELRTQVLFGAALFAVGLVLSRVPGRLARLGLILLSLTVSTRYLYWRLSNTLAAQWSADAAVGFILLAAELYAYAVLLLGYVQVLEPLRRRPVPLPADVARWLSVDVFIPTYNEPLEVVRATVLAAKAMDWPSDRLKVYLLDDGRRADFRAFAARAGVAYIVRPDNAHAKAGNLNHALGRSRGQLIVIFDCDHVPTRAFLQTTVGLLMRDPKLAMVQTPHHFYSPDPFERNLGHFRTMPNEGELFYGLIQRGNDLWDAAFFCGSCAVVRRSALEEVGGIAVETVTEDAHTMLELHRRGHSSAYLDVPLAGGLATESLAAHVGQRIRWARGMAQIFRVDNPLLGRGLDLPQRLCYAAATLHFFYGIPRLIFLLAPLSFLVFGAQIFNAAPLLVLAYALPHLAHSVLTSSCLYGQHRRSFWSEVYETVLAFHVMIPTTLALLAPRHGKFNVTAKGGLVEEPFFARRMALPNLLLAGFNLIGLGAGIWRLVVPRQDVDVVLMNLAWTINNLAILGAALAVAWEARQRRRTPRVSVVLPAMVRLPSGHTLRARTRDLSRGGAALALRAEQALAAGARVRLSIFTGRDERPLPATVVGHAGGVLRVRFDELTIAEESWLVEALFARADAWSGWRQGRRGDFVPGALAGIVGQALRAVVRACQRRPRPAAPAEAA